MAASEAQIAPMTLLSAYAVSVDATVQAGAMTYT